MSHLLNSFAFRKKNEPLKIEISVARSLSYIAACSSFSHQLVQALKSVISSFTSGFLKVTDGHYLTYLFIQWFFFAFHKIPKIILGKIQAKRLRYVMLSVPSYF